MSLLGAALVAQRWTRLAGRATKARMACCWASSGGTLESQNQTSSQRWDSPDPRTIILEDRIQGTSGPASVRGSILPKYWRGWEVRRSQESEVRTLINIHYSSTSSPRGDIDI